MILAIDFDGTLSYGKWPDIGPANYKLINFLNKRKSNGDKLILWTCRDGEDLVSAVNWCEEQGLIFDCVNENLPEIIDKFGSNSRKIFCDYYIDDRAINMNVLNLLNFLGGFCNEQKTI